jgi:hypothetical protein
MEKPGNRTPFKDYQLNPGEVLTEAQVLKMDRKIPDDPPRTHRTVSFKAVGREDPTLKKAYYK